ncbi:AAA family ATPase [Halomonas sp. LBP4]|uniref:AAA family ATPase n=1 Tax=Halomonas sp. LBP4 TaxID=2044917 RepID=UPI000D76317D|nr:AAA family ATPase [Halomonas sp. LBP4]PXX98659.1 chromosome segregation protein SMC [Halomonas sp. LBP4]
MKILALRLANLASLPGPLELDFTAPPLRDAGLFAITGPTGAGKSTLLDALCLALYGSTPRLRQAPGRDAPLPDVGEETLNTADPRTLLRRGTASGHAEVDFLGRDGRRYRARWAVRRAREKAEGRLQAVEQSLRDLDDDRLLTTQKREFDRLLPERLGLTFDQFTRAVLLAQSEFAAFLQADDNERSDLLERLTGTAEYSAISIAAYRRANEAKKQVDALEARLADDRPAEPEARAELVRAARDSDAALAALDRQAGTLAARRDAFQRHRQLHDEREAARSRHARAEQAWQALAPRRAEQAQLEALAPQRHRFAHRERLEADLARLNEARTATRHQLAQAEQALDRHVTTLQAAETALAQAMRDSDQARPALQAARGQAARLAGLDREIARSEAEQRRQRDETDGVQRELAETRAASQRRRQERDDLEAKLQTHLGDDTDIGRARGAWQAAFEAAAHRHLALEALQGAWQAAIRARERHAALEESRRQDQATRERLLVEGREAAIRLEGLEAEQRRLVESLERLRAARSESVVWLRDRLREGEPCPVCGGRDHPWRHHPPETPEAARLAATEAEEERQQQEAETRTAAARERHHQLQGEYRALDARLRQHEKDLERAARERAEADDTLAGQALVTELEPVAETERSAWLTRELATARQARDRAREALQTIEAAEARLAPLREALQRDELTLGKLATRQESLEEAQRRLAAELAPQRRQRQALAEELAEVLGEHASPDAWQAALEQAVENARAGLEAARRDHQAGQSERDRLDQQATYQRRQAETLTNERDELVRSLDAWRRRHPKLDDATLARLLAVDEAGIDARRQELESADRERHAAGVSLDERQRALVAHRRDAFPEIPATTPEEAIEAKLHALSQRLDEEERDLAPRRQAARDARDAAMHALRDDDRRRDRQREGRAELDAARAEQVRWGRISELIGSADGKAFRRIAQAYNLERLLDQANAHLGGLTRRYLLERGGSPLGLLVVDRDMADERRSVHSLSGGETFLVSLALALGLASMASGELTIESLFIDEGFGSLDPQSLALAMEALDGLQALGRRVGVISHVQEMHERIPVQVHVEPLGNGTSRARLVSV